MTYLILTVPLFAAALLFLRRLTRRRYITIKRLSVRERGE